MEFDDIFAEFEEPHADEHDFLTLFQEAMDEVPVKFVSDTAEEVTLSSAQSFPPEVSIEPLFAEMKKNEDSFGWQERADSLLCGVVVAELSGALFCVVPGGNAELDTWKRVVANALKYCRAKRQSEHVQLENEQLQRQAEALRQQHAELVENNHRQYRKLQDKEKEYAQELEAEIAKQTAELRQANRELIEAARLKDEFLANMSHELRTPMNAIIGFSELLTETEMSPVQADYAQTIWQSGSGLLSLINDILDFAKIEANKLDIESVPFHLGDLLKNISAMFAKPVKEKGISFYHTIRGSESLEFLGDGNRIKQVLVNLSGNAVKFTGKGEIELRVTCTHHDEKCATLEFSVRDTGIGIPPDRQSAVFEKFVQADGSTTRKFGGTGLGLAISNKLVSLMGGTISLESEEGKGSVFRFSLVLPYAQKHATPAGSSEKIATSSEDAVESIAAKKVILVVEDNLVNQKLASVLIKKQGCDVVVAEDGLVALEKLRTQRFDLILMDLQMPNMGGLEATQRIREIESSAEASAFVGLHNQEHPVPIVGLSAHARKEDTDAGLASGMNDFLTKPIVRPKLEAVLKQIGS